MAQSDRKANRDREKAQASEAAEEAQTTARSGKLAAAEDDEFLYVGIDLGTSRSSIAASNGIRSVIPSVVGWPKDSIARKLLKTSVLVGKDAQENRLCLDMIHPLEHGVLRGSGDDSDEGKAALERSLAAAREILMHLVKEVKPLSGQTIYGVIGAPAQASVKNKKALIKVAEGILDAVIVVSEPFSVAYGMDRLQDTLVVDIGAGTTDLCRMYGAFPTDEDQLTLTAGGDTIDELLYQSLVERKTQAQFNLNMVRKAKEQFGFVDEAQKEIKVAFPVDGIPQEIDITEEMRAACSSIVPEILESIQLMLRSFDPEFQHRIRQNVLLAGGGSQLEGLEDVIERGLTRLGGGKVTRVDEPVYAGAGGALKLAHDLPADTWKPL